VGWGEIQRPRQRDGQIGEDCTYSHDQSIRFTARLLTVHVYMVHLPGVNWYRSGSHLRVENCVFLHGTGYSSYAFRIKMAMRSAFSKSRLEKITSLICSATIM
jgi:hypothetical protein